MCVVGGLLSGVWYDGFLLVDGVDTEMICPGRLSASNPLFSLSVFTDS